MKKSVFGILLLLMIISGCSKVEVFDQDAREKVQLEVKKFLDAYHRAMESEGLLSEVDYLDNSDDFFWVPPGYGSALSYDSVMTILTTNAPSIQKMKIEKDYLYVFPHSFELATFTTRLRNTTIDTAGVTSAVSMLETGTLIKRPKGWQLLNGQSRIISDE